MFPEYQIENYLVLESKHIRDPPNVLQDEIQVKDVCRVLRLGNNYS